ncbi:MAG: SDR family oxidoreductase [Caldanaerobacter subterraneus]|nr:SDR family oxidoreductase [Caldanaerobacter subterraneus]
MSWTNRNSNDQKTISLRKEQVIKSIPLGRFAKSIEIAEVVVFLASKESSYITGETINVDGGLLMD